MIKHASSWPPNRQSEVEQLLYLCHRIRCVYDRVPNRPWVLVDLVIITSLVGFVAKEVDCSILNPTRLLCLVLQVLQTISLVPSCREDIEGDLPSD
jgi:hypothetical protein